MRDATRCYIFGNEIIRLWTKYCPDWRFGQLMENFFSACGDPYYWEEDTFIDKLEEYLKKTFGEVD